MDDKKLFTLINLLHEKTKNDLIQWSTSGTNDSDWGTLIGSFWVVISAHATAKDTIVVKVLKESEVYVNVCIAEVTLSRLYDLVKEKVSVENKVLDQLIDKLNQLQPRHADSYYKD